MTIGGNHDVGARRMDATGVAEEPAPRLVRRAVRAGEGAHNPLALPQHDIQDERQPRPVRREHHVAVDGIAIDSVRTAFIRFENNYHGGRGGFHPTRFENFRISNIRGGKSKECGFYAIGVEGYPIRNIALENITFEDCKTAYTLVNTEDISFDHVSINGQVLPRVPDDTEASQLRTD